MILNEILPERLWQADLYGAIDLCVYSNKHRAMGESGTVMIGGVICAAFDFRFNYARGVHALLLAMHDGHVVDPAWFDMAVDFHRRFGPTLVHCYAGRSRSVAMAAAIAWSEGQDLEETFKKCDSKPNTIVDQSLMAWAAARPKGT